MYCSMRNSVLFIVPLLLLITCCNGVRQRNNPDGANSKNIQTNASKTIEKPQNEFPPEIARIMSAVNRIKDEARVKSDAEKHLKKMGVQERDLEKYTNIAYERWMTSKRLQDGTSLPCKIRKIEAPHNAETKKSIEGLLSQYEEYKSILSDFKDNAFVCETRKKEFLGLIAYRYENNGRWLHFDLICMHDHTPEGKAVTTPVKEFEKLIGIDLIKELDQDIKSERKIRRSYTETPFKLNSKTEHEFFTLMFQDNGFSFELADGGMPAILDKFYTPDYKHEEDKWAEIAEIPGDADSVLCKVRHQGPKITAKTADKIEDLMRIVHKWDSTRPENYHHYNHTMVCESPNGEFLAYIAYEYNQDETEITLSKVVFLDSALAVEKGNQFLKAWDEELRKNKKAFKVTGPQNSKEEINNLMENIGFKKTQVSTKDGKCERVLTKIYPKGKTHEGIPAEVIFTFSDLRDILTCPICQNSLKQPIVLPCGHAVCEECYFGMRRKLCPECRTIVANYLDSGRAFMPSVALKKILSHPHFAQVDDENDKDENKSPFEFLVTYAGNLITVKGLEPSDSVSVLKKRIEDCTGLGGKEQNVIFGGRKLEDENMKISDYNVKANVMLHLLRRVTD